MKRTINALFWISLLSLAGCGTTERDRENYGSITNPALNDQTRHSAGWGRSDCTVCHNIDVNVHRRAGNQLDADAIREDAHANGGDAYCLRCHTGNGL